MTVGPTALSHSRCQVLSATVTEAAVTEAKGEALKVAQTFNSSNRKAQDYSCWPLVDSSKGNGALRTTLSQRMKPEG